MTAGNNRAVVIDTMVVSALMNSAHDPTAARYLSIIASRSILVSFVTVTEMRYGALKARWGDLRRRGLNETSPASCSSFPTTRASIRCPCGSIT